MILDERGCEIAGGDFTDVLFVAYRALTNRKHMLFISWQPHCSRSDNIARELGGHSVMIYSPRWGRSTVTLPFRWLSQALKTARCLLKERPEIIYVMTPPVVACFPVWLYTVLSGARFIIDAHSGAFIDRRWQRVLFLHKFASRRAAATLVTNEALQREVESWGAKAIIVTDVPIEFEEQATKHYKDRFRVVMPVSFTYDEPIDKVMEAARVLINVEFLVTGDVTRAPRSLLRRKPRNVTFTGFLAPDEYGALLSSADLIMALTTCDDTMQRGAYEAVYLGRPVITSNFAILRNAFNKGTVHVDNSCDDIVSGIRTVMEDLPKFQREVRLLRAEKLAHWRLVSEKLQNV